MADELQIFKFASTLFLGLGITAVLQGRLVAREPDFPISEKARRIWSTVDVLGASTMLVLIGFGEFLVLRVLERGSADGDERTVTIILLAVTATFVAVQATLQRGLAVAWNEEEEGAEPGLDRNSIVNFVAAVCGGLFLGGVVFFAIVTKQAEVLLASLISLVYLAFLSPRVNPPFRK